MGFFTSDFHRLGRPRLCAVALLGLSCLAASANAACMIELSTYADRDHAAEIDFSPTLEGATVTNSFKMLLDNAIVLDGFVQWTESVARGYGTLQYQCPQGDVTGEEYAACTVWQGVIYAASDKGDIELVPAEGQAAPKRLILADLGPSLRASAAFGEAGLPRVPWDVFEMNGCQE